MNGDFALGPDGYPNIVVYSVESDAEGVGVYVKYEQALADAKSRNDEIRQHARPGETIEPESWYYVVELSISLTQFVERDYAYEPDERVRAYAEGRA